MLGCVQGLKKSLLAANSAVPRGVLTVIRIVVRMDEEGFGVEILALRLSHWSVLNDYTILSPRFDRCEVESYDRVNRAKLRTPMKPPKRYQDIFVTMDFLTTRDDIIRGVVKIDKDTYKVAMEHPVFGTTIEIFEHDPSDDTLCLRSVFPTEMQSEEEIEAVKDYLNNFILKGEQTFIEYYNPQAGYFLLSRNVGVYPVGSND